MTTDAQRCLEAWDGQGDFAEHAKKFGATAITKLYVIFANHEFDGVEETPQQALIEMRDLKRLGCDHVQAFEVSSDSANIAWKVAYEIEDISRARSFGRKGMAKLMAENYNTSIILVGIQGLEKMIRWTGEVA